MIDDLSARANGPVCAADDAEPFEGFEMTLERWLRQLRLGRKRRERLRAFEKRLKDDPDRGAEQDGPVAGHISALAHVLICFSALAAPEKPAPRQRQRLDHEVPPLVGMPER